MTRVVLISGARKGIGRFLCEHHLAAGDTVIGCSRRNTDLAHENYKHHELDVADDKAVRRMVRQIIKDYGKLDVLLNNAGIASMNALLLTPSDTAKKILATNTLGTFLLLREAGKAMVRSSYGRIVNFSTVAVPFRLEGEAVYAASKSAVEALTQIGAKELGSYGITVNAIGPTPIQTDLIKLIPNEKIAKLLERQAIARLGTFKDVLNVIEFLLKDESDFVTGQTIYLGGVNG